MNDAAVGFQCPSCIAEGKKTTRTGRTAYGGLRSSNPGTTTMALITISVSVWVAILVTGWESSDLVQRLALTPEGACWLTDGSGYFRGVPESRCVQGNVAWVDGVSNGAYWQLLTSAFTHVQVWHIGFNMFALWALGPQLETVLGRARYLALYLLSAMAGSALVYWAAGEQTPTLGASGAVFGLLGALLVIAYKVHGNVRALLPWLAINAAITFLVPNVSWQGHVGGFVGGVLVAAAIVYAPKQHRTRFQVGMLTLIGVVIIAAIVARTVVLT